MLDTTTMQGDAATNNETGAINALDAWAAVMPAATAAEPVEPAPASEATQTRDDEVTPVAPARTTKRSARSDVHRPGAIDPRNYRYLISYSFAGSNALFEPAINLDVARKIWCDRTWMNDAPIEGVSQERFGSLGQCGVCGAHFRHGDIWMHEPTGALVAFGHECAHKYELLADRDDWCAQLEALKKGRKAKLEELRRDEAFAHYCARYPGLADALSLDHKILVDMKGKLRRWGSLSEKQIAFALRLANEVRNPAPKPVERHVAAPEGRVSVRGVLVSKKTQDGAYGTSIKMTVKVETAEGSWLAWGTMPSSLASFKGADGYNDWAKVGDTVEFTATLKRGRDAHFALFSRPTNGVVVARASQVAA